MINKNDWRLTNQINYLQDAKLMKVQYKSKAEHDHCVFCWHKINNENDIGFCTLDKYHWICEGCYNDFKEMFNWKLVD